jgi:phosphonate transport system substrate-binding protein
LAAIIRKAFFEFDDRGTSLQKRFEDSGASKFVPLSYKQDYALVRQIDSAFRKPAPGASN